MTDIPVRLADRPSSAVRCAEDDGTVMHMTENQLLVWASQRLQPDNALYRIGFAFTIPTAVEYEPFQQAFQALIDASDAMRSVVTEIDGTPHVRVMRHVPYTLPYLDISPATRPAYHAWARERFRGTRFDPADLPFDSLLLKLSPHTYGWYLCMNHLFSDGWSLALALKYMADFYQQAKQGELPLSVDLPQFETYVAYERAERDSEHYRQAKAYWQEKLSRPLEPVSLYGRRRPTDRTRADRVSVELGADRSRRLMELAQHPDLFVKTEKVTLFNIFVALMAAYVSRVSDVRYVSIGSPFLGRPTERFRRTMGFFVEVFPLHVDVRPEDTLVSLVQRVAAEAQETLRHRRYPVRNPIRRPAYEFSVNFPQPFLAEFDGAPVLSYWIPHEHQTVSIALTFHDYDGSGNLTVDFDLHCDVFPEPQQSRVVAHFLQLLDSLLDDPTRPVAQARLLPPSERQRLLVDFARTVDVPLGSATVVDLFEAQAAAHPRQPALISGDRVLTYAELEQRANQLAYHLQTLGVAPETLVGLCVERSPEMILGLLAILKAGGAYVPIDPAYPTERQAFMIADSGVPVLLTQSHLADQLPDADLHLVALDTVWPSVADYADTPPESGVTGCNLAYVIYTSGSTGQPKGVQIEHRGLANQTLAARDLFAQGVGDRVLQFLSISFDAAAEEIFPCLASGAALVLRDDAMLASPSVFLERCGALGVTMTVLPTAFWHQVAAALSADALQVPQCMRLFVAGGERMLPERVRVWQACVGQRVRLINAYGPTEATVVAARADLTAISAHDLGEEVPIGRPPANVQVYLLDAQLQPVPTGVPGELCIGGAGVARGYLNSPALTAERFVPDPFSGEPGARLYRTGDMARFRSDGAIEFLGRVDRQVKVRGFRIELGAVETVLRQHPSVRDVVVLAREDEPGDKRLVAYVVLDQQDADIGTLFDCVKEQLPAYMLPAAFVTMAALPLTTNGKVDRRALPAPDLSRPELGRDFVAPRGEIERQLVQIWEALLDAQPIGVRDDFFELGGHSLLAVRLTACIEETFGVNIPLTTVFQEPTVEQLTRHVAWQQGMTIWPPLVTIQPQGDRPPFFCVHPLCGDVVSFTIWSRYLGQDQPFYGLRARGLDGVQDPVTEVEAMAADYVDQLRSVQPEGPYYLGGYAGGGVIAFEMAQQLSAQGAEVAFLLIINEPPPNADYRRFSLRPRVLVSFFRNLPHWIHEFLRLRLAQLVFRLQLQLRPAGLIGRLEQHVKLPSGLARLQERLQGRSRQLIDEHNRALLDHDNVPRVHDARQRRIALLHREALRRYTPQSYPGRATVFRTRRQPLFCSFDPHLCWGDLVDGGIDVREIPGSTASVLKDPHARALADQLDICLANARHLEDGGLANGKLEMSKL